MRRLRPRGDGGVVVDADGATLAADCVLVMRAVGGFISITREAAAIHQAVLLQPGLHGDWLFEQSRRIAIALSRGEIALAQIYGLRIPFIEAHRRANRPAELLGKANFNPDEPRLPKGQPGAGQWTDGGDSHALPRSGGGQSEGGGDAPPDAGGEPIPVESKPGMEYRLPIPSEEPPTPRERNSIIRRTAEALRRLGGSVRNPRVRAILTIIERVAWLAEHLPEILSYLDGPKSLEELQKGVDDLKLGYQIHHIVEAQYGSTAANSNARRFGARLETDGNRVLIPRWKHVQISSWYSARNDLYRGMTPRAYLRGKSWQEQYELGINKLRDFGVLK